MRREGYDRYVPLPEDVSDLDGVPVGVSVKDDQISIPVSLPQDGRFSDLRFVDLGGSPTKEAKSPDLKSPNLKSPDRVHETYYVDFADRQRCACGEPGLSGDS